ncbi:bactofilin family protein [Brevibacillus migulae]|uniref:bactofilin family protein n=1 Tax=Brevibacillus migulae TaxID=1644114 RepID=UPI00106DE1A7|nr:polymer-forming cytoskeletal protein [Brevibacillus migulae]
MFNSSKQAKPTITDKIETIIGAGTAVKGTLTVSGTIRVDGMVNGEIFADGDVIIGETGHVIGIVKGRNITVAGRLEGNADAAGLLQLTSTAAVRGDMVVDSFTVEEGAKYKGSFQMKQDVEVSEQLEVMPA